MTAAAKARADKLYRLYSEGFPPVTVDFSDLNPVESERAGSAALVRGVAAGLAKRGYAVGGADVCVQSSIPEGAGLSSSAAFETLTGVILGSLYNRGEIDAVTIARAAQEAENLYFGKPCGLMDQMGCAVGGVISLDFSRSDLDMQRIEADFSSLGYELFIVNAGGSHAGLTSEYADIPAEMSSVAAMLGRERLGDVPEEDFVESIPRLRGRLPDRAILRAMHFFGENRRVVSQVDALRRKDMKTYLRLMNASGQSSAELLQNIFPACDKTERSVSLALALSRRVLDGRGAWRVHGGGFAGTVQALAPTELAEEYGRSMGEVFGSANVLRLGIRPEGVVALSI
jgi:galactokinase